MELANKFSSVNVELSVGRRRAAETVLTKTQAVEAAHRKLDESKYFLQRLFESREEGNIHSTERAFQYNFNAFLTASRSIVQVIGKGFGRTFVENVTTAWGDLDQNVLRILNDKRDLVIHCGESATESEVKMVSAHELPMRQRSALDGYVVQQRLPGWPAPKYSKLVFTVNVSCKEEDAIECARSYLSLAQKVLSEADAFLQSPQANS